MRLVAIPCAVAARLCVACPSTRTAHRANRLGYSCACPCGCPDLEAHRLTGSARCPVPCRFPVPCRLCHRRERLTGLTGSAMRSPVRPCGCAVSRACAVPPVRAAVPLPCPCACPSVPPVPVPISISRACPDSLCRAARLCRLSVRAVRLSRLCVAYSSAQAHRERGERLTGERLTGLTGSQGTPRTAHRLEAHRLGAISISRAACPDSLCRAARLSVRLCRCRSAVPSTRTAHRANRRTGSQANAANG